MVSLDVVNMFNNIMFDDVINCIKERWEDIKVNTLLPEAEFIRLTNFILDSSYFKFRDKYYKQIHGTPMGGPSSPSMADLVMDVLLDHVIPLLDFELPWIKKYVDDHLLLIPFDKVDYVLQKFNSYNSNIQFTCETEINRKLPFLDIQLYRANNLKIETCLYKKPTSSGRILNYLSLHPRAQKLNTAQNYIKRVISFCNPYVESDCKKCIFKTLQNNNYPPSLIKKMFATQSQKNNNNNIATSEDSNNKFIGINYKHRLS
jgi:hypothetical protein